MIKKVIFKIYVSLWGDLVKKCILIAYGKCISSNGFGAEKSVYADSDKRYSQILKTIEQ